MIQNKPNIQIRKVYNYRKSLSHYLHKCQQRKLYLKINANFNSQIIATNHHHKITPNLLSFQQGQLTKFHPHQKYMVDWQSHNFKKNTRRKHIHTLSQNLQLKKNNSIAQSVETFTGFIPKPKNPSNLSIFLSNKLSSTKYRSKEFCTPITANHCIRNNGVSILPKSSITSKRKYQSSIIRFQPWQTKGDIFNETTQIPSNPARNC